jgi:hypothetical protein
MTASHMQDIHHAFASATYMFHFTIQRLKLLVAGREQQMAGLGVHTVILFNLHALQTLRIACKRRDQQQYDYT